MRTLTALLGICATVFGLPPGSADTTPSSSAVADLSIEQLLNATVVSAVLRRQTTADAPASMTVISAREIRQYGYRTLAEALNSVRGLSVSTDRSYSFLGARGFSLPGDFGSRYLLLINGHSMADPVFEQSGLLGQELGIDLDLVKQIEILHGPASALYGSNAVLCTINVITRTAADLPALSVSADMASHGEQKLRASYARGGPRGSVLLNASAFRSAGEKSLYFPEYDSPATNLGRANDVDGQWGYHLYGLATWGRWSFQGLMGQRRKIMPVSYGETIFGDRGTRVLDQIGFGEATYTRPWAHGEWEWRLSVNAYRYHGYYRYEQEDGRTEDNREIDRSDWASSKLVYRTSPGRWGTTTVGVEARWELRTEQLNFDVQPEPRDILWLNRPDRPIGLFAQHELALGRRWTAILGGRFDHSTYRNHNFAPRLGLLWKAAPGTVLKLLYSDSFRNPLPYELFYTDNASSSANPLLRAERAHTYELAAERRLSASWKLTASAYRTSMRNLITAGRSADGALRYDNQGRNLIYGTEVELSGRLSTWLETAASLAFQDNGQRLSQSPRHVDKLRLSVPLWDRRLSMNGAVRWISQRDTLDGQTVPGVLLTDITVTTQRLLPKMDFQFGVRNLLDRRYQDPIALSSRVAAAPQVGRTSFVRLFWRSEE